ncbi:MAG: OmpA family protein, partial [Bdellovibrionales bacterium]|nr:OmpA family protein [Bdellovibrionales bacterium]
SHEELALGEDLPKEVMTRLFVYVFLRALGGNDATGSRVSFLDRAHLLEQKNQTPLYTSHDEKLLQFLYGFDDGGSFVSPEVQEELDALQNIEQKILFETASAKIKVLSNGILDNVVEILQKYPTALIEIQAHTDSRGEDDYNIDLSKRRGQAVKDYLVSKGISSSRLSVKGFGESAPIADNNTADGRAKNRRVAFKVLNSES